MHKMEKNAAVKPEALLHVKENLSRFAILEVISSQTLAVEVPQSLVMVADMDFFFQQRN